MKTAASHLTPPQPDHAIRQYNFPMRPAANLLLLAASLLLLPPGTFAQNPTPPAVDPLTPSHTLIPLNLPPLPPGVVELMKLEGEFSDSVEKGGGKAFASWFADDAVTLNNGKPAILGRTAIAAAAKWDPKTYHLSWYPEGAQMGPSGDTGFTWGHYDAKSQDGKGQPVTLSGRYITFWKKVGGHWKVALDASADDAPAEGDCCRLPTP
jgi:ketosteroid isomerase-like protein